MFHKVLVPLDGSWFAEAALPAAARIAKAAGGTLDLVMVRQPVAALSGLGDLLVASPDFDLELLARDQVYLAETAAGVSAQRRLPVGYRAVDGTAGPEICEEAARVGADLVVMATHGRGGFRRFWLGGVADYVIRHIGGPVLLVHPGRTAMLPEPPAPRRILVALDLSHASEAILEPAIALAWTSGAALTLVHVAEPTFTIPMPGMPGAQPDMDLLETAREVGQKRLKKLATRSRRLGLEPDIRVVIGVGAADALLNLMEGDEFDLVAMTTHGRGGVRRLLLGSVADQVIRGTTKPVLVLRPPVLVS
jgi:nucleotide-binding universal stress UspA family protein